VRHLGRSGARGGHASRMSRVRFAELLKILQFSTTLVAFFDKREFEENLQSTKRTINCDMWLALLAINSGKGFYFFKGFLFKSF